MKLRLFFHLLAQILAQTAIIAIVPGGVEKYYAAAVAVVGVIVAYFDTTPVQ